MWNRLLNGFGLGVLGVVAIVVGVTSTHVPVARADCGVFAEDVEYGVGMDPRSVAIGDLDGDGDVDIAVANFGIGNNNVSVLLNNGDGTFAADVLYGVGFNPISVAVGDLDGDGDADLAVANFSSANVSVLLNNGDGTFAADVIYGVGVLPHSVAIGDLDGDGDADLAVVNEFSDDVSVLLNNGDGTFAAHVLYDVGDQPFSVAMGDLDGDGDIDLAVANSLDNNVSVLLNNGGGTFAADVVYGTGSFPKSVAIGDLDGDGDADLVVATGPFDTDNVSVLLNNGDGTFTANVLYDAGPNPHIVAIGDLNGDGDPDLVVANALGGGGDNVAVLLNHGDGTFADLVLIGAGESATSVAIGDLDGDGDADLAVANLGGDTVSILLNQCGVGIPCGDVVGSLFACNSTDALKLAIRLSDFSHDGEIVALSVDGVPHDVTVEGKRARLFLPGQSPGNHTVELTDPAGCIPPETVTCGSLFQVIFPEAMQTGSQDFALVDGKIVITVQFNRDVDLASLLPGTNVILVTETDANADITIAPGTTGSEIVITSDADFVDLCIFDSDCFFTLRLLGDAADPIQSDDGEILDGDGDNTPGGDYETSFVIIG